MSNRFFLIVEIITASLVVMLAISSAKLGKAERRNRKAISNAYSVSKEREFLFKNAIRLDGANPVYHFNLGLHFIAQQNQLSAGEMLSNGEIAFPDSAIVPIENAVTMTVKEPVFLLNQALIEELSGNRYAAIALLEPMTQHAQCWAPVRLVYGLWQEAEGNRVKAQQAYTQAIIQSPVVIESRFFRELMKRDQRLADEARISALEETLGLLQKKPSPLCMASLGEQEYYDGSREKSISLLTEALAEQPSMNRPWLFLGRMAEENGDFEKAIKYYEKAVLLDEDDALAVYFKTRISGGTWVQAEQMQDMMANPQRIGLFARYGSRVLMPYLIIPDLEMYCTYDYVGEIRANQDKMNLGILENLRAELKGKETLPIAELTSEVAAFFVGIPCEAGLLDIWPERLRIRLDRTDPLHFVEMCIALAKTLRTSAEAPPESFYESYCDMVQKLRYRNGKVEKYTDRIYYFSEWAAQARGLNLLEEHTKQYGQEYVQLFSYLSNHLMFLPQIGREPKAREEILDIEKKLNTSGPFFLIPPDEMTDEWQASLLDGDLIAFVSDRKGEDVSKLAFIRRENGILRLVHASLQDKKITKEDFPSLEEFGRGVRLFRIQ